MSLRTRFADGLRSFTSALVNRRSASAQNGFELSTLTRQEQTAIYATGLGSKIVRLKAGGALAGTIQFETSDDEDFYDRRLKYRVREAARWMLVYGRGIAVVFMPGDDLRTPLDGKRVDSERAQCTVFSGDMITVSDIERDLQHPRYYQPKEYMVRGEPIHHSRVVDFTYIKPPELEAPRYQYGGISEFDLIYDQLIADGVVQRASPRVIDKASTLFYKVEGFRDAMKLGQEKDMVDYFTRLEDVRGIMSAGLVDKDDEIHAVDQTISNLADADQITLRRLAMVTGLSITRLVGENVKGLNSSGENEQSMDREMLETFQDEYLLPRINELMALFGRSAISFRDNQGETAGDRIEYETTAINNARVLYEMGEDFVGYLRGKDILQADNFDTMFPPPGVDDADAAERDRQTLAEFEQAGAEAGTDDTEDAADPRESLNGAQIEGLLSILSRIRTGELTPDTASAVIMAAFPLSEPEARGLVEGVPHDVDEPEDAGSGEA